MASSPSSRDYARVYDIAAVVVLVVATAVLWWTWRDYGMSWDERIHATYGDHIYDFFESRGEDQSALTYRIDYLYGGSFDLLGAAFGKLVDPPLNRWDGLHLFGALIGPLGLWGAWMLGRTLGGPRAGLLAALFIVGTSVYWGHAVNNPKDMPFAVGYVWAMVYLVQAIRQFPTIERGTAIRLAVCAGLAMSVRIGGLLVMCYFAGAILVWLGHEAWHRRSFEAVYRYGLRLCGRAAAIAAGAWAVMLVWWPWALYDPLRRPLIALTRMSNFMAHKRKMPFAGETIWTYDIDWRYMPHYFGLKLPEFIVIFALLGLVVGVVVLIVRARDFRVFKDNLVLGTVLVSLLFPWTYAIYKESVFYDGLRHFLFEVPVVVACVAWLMSVGIGALVGRAMRWKAWAGYSSGAIAALLVGLLCVDQYATMVRLHPFQYVYFNRFIGGVEGAVGNYDTDYYATTYGTGTAEIAQRLWETEPDEFLNTVYTVNGCASSPMLLQRAPPNFQKQSKLADFWLGYTRKNCHKTHKDVPAMFKVERDGGVLLVVRDIRKKAKRIRAKQDRRRKRDADKRREEAKKRREAAKKKANENNKDGDPSADDKPGPVVPRRVPVDHPKPAEKNP